MTTTDYEHGDLDVALAAIRERYRSADVRASLTTLTGSANDVPFLLALVESIREHRRRAEDACQMLGRVVTGHARAMEAARIELAQGDARKAMEWILNSLPDVDDNPPEDQWNGTETAQEWFDRTR